MSASVAPCNICPVKCSDGYQPYGVEVRTADGVFVKQMYIPHAGTIVPQHSHEYDHLTLIGYGAIRVWRDGLLVGDLRAPYPMHISKGTKHAFQSLVDGTTLYCIHNIARSGKVDVREEHQLAGRV